MRPRKHARMIIAILLALLTVIAVALFAWVPTNTSPRSTGQTSPVGSTEQLADPPIPSEPASGPSASPFVANAMRGKDEPDRASRHHTRQRISNGAPPQWLLWRSLHPRSVSRQKSSLRFSNRRVALNLSMTASAPS